MPARLEQSVVWSLVDQGDVLQPRRLGEVGWGTLLSEAVGGDCLAGPPRSCDGLWGTHELPAWSLSMRRRRRGAAARAIV